jgi:carbonic anhydrase/acetyltransferase-like protein (isoleucine patch superfamily)
VIYTLENQQIELLGDNHFIAPNATLIGAVQLHDNVSIWFNAAIRADNHPIVIGADSNIQDGAVLHTDPGIPLTLGTGVTVGHMAMLHGCSIGDNCLIGIKAVVLNGAKIGANCLIGANALVTEGKEIPDGSMVLGVPGKVVRQLTDEEIAGLRHAAEHYVDNGQHYRQHLKETNHG